MEVVQSQGDSDLAAKKEEACKYCKKPNLHLQSIRHGSFLFQHGGSIEVGVVVRNTGKKMNNNSNNINYPHQHASLYRQMGLLPVNKTVVGVFLGFPAFRWGVHQH